MKRKTKNAFTLVELLAVIVILAIILVIAVPKVMSVIEDSKKATLESTAKMIASSAEKQKVQNTVLGNTNEITCDSVAKINKGDYASCTIEFENNTAKVTIEGSGKFEGLWVCGGTKTSAEASDEECANNNGVAFIQDLLAKEETLNNGLVQTTAEYNGTTYDAGIRYVGAMDDVKNKVYYNCEDTDASGVAYGADNYDYASSCEVWRIIGVFDTKSSESGTAEKRVKLINTESTFEASWDSSTINENGGWGINQWGPSGDYDGADIMKLLNGYYIGIENSTCRYCNDLYQENCKKVCTSESLMNENMKPLTRGALEMIDDAVWDTYAVKWPDNGITDATWASTAYLEEKGISTQYTGNSSCIEVYGANYVNCNDGVERTTNWTGLVGLMSVSDIAYADGWLYNQIGNELFPWTISPNDYPDAGFYVWFADYDRYGSIIHEAVSKKEAIYMFAIFPSVYLNPNIQIIGGDGSTEPYKLK